MNNSSETMQTGSDFADMDVAGAGSSTTHLNEVDHSSYHHTHSDNVVEVPLHEARIGGTQFCIPVQESTVHADSAINNNQHQEYHIHMRSDYEAIEQKRKKSPTSTITQGSTSGSSSSTITEAIIYKQIYPCKNAVNPAMRSLHDRVNTFDGRWKTYMSLNGKNISIIRIAEAGFYFIGDNDKTKCWYCSGGIQRWEEEDCPMEEHCKWFPKCEFVLQVLGPVHVQEIQEKFYNLNRPNISNAVDCSTGIEIIKKIKHTNMSTLDAFYQTSIFHTMLGMGFNRDTIDLVIMSRWKNDNSLFTSSEELMDTLLNTDVKKQELTSISDCDVTLTSVGVPLITSKRSHDSNNNDNRLCTKCKVNPAQFVHIPCAHLDVCQQCVTDVCGKCKQIVDKSIRIYL